MDNETKDILNNILTKVVAIDAKVNGINGIEERMFTKDDAAEMKSELYSHIDGFVKLHETLDQELVSLRNKYDRLDERLQKVEQKVL